MSERPSPQAAAPTLKHGCWIHDSPDEYGAKSCDLCYWLCPECGGPMYGEPSVRPRGQDSGRRLFRGTWRCDECETFIDFAKMKPEEK